MSADYSEPAFPVHETPDSTDSPGMTLRDYMAAKAMHGCISGIWPDGSYRDEIARFAYAMADAMLRERAK